MCVGGRQVFTQNRRQHDCRRDITHDKVHHLHLTAPRCRRRVAAFAGLTTTSLPHVYAEGRGVAISVLMSLSLVLADGRAIAI